MTWKILFGYSLEVKRLPRELDIQDVLGINNYIAKFYQRGMLGVNGL